MLIAAMILIMTSCATVKPYDMVYLNDYEMDPDNSSPRGYEKYVQSIREGATPANGSKTSGGCGCN